MRILKQTPQKKATKTESKFNTSDTILFVLFLISMGVTIWGIDIYRMTIIPSKYLFGAIAIGTFIAFPLIQFGLKPSYKTIWLFMTSIAIGGGSLYFSLLYLNSTYSDKEKMTKDFNIVRTGTLAKGRSSSCGSPYAVVDFNGTEKDLIFYCEYENTIGTFSKVRLEYSKGLFGYDIIKSKTLLK